MLNMFALNDLSKMRLYSCRTRFCWNAKSVLRSGYGYEAPKFVEAIREFAGLPTVNLENPKLAAIALTWHERGMDFADAMHLGRAEGCEAFVSFDKGLAKAARSSARSTCARRDGRTAGRRSLRPASRLRSSMGRPCNAAAINLSVQVS